MENASGLELVNISAFEGESISQAYSAIGSTFGYQNQQAFLGYNSYILDPVEEDDGNTVYLSNIALVISINNMIIKLMGVMVNCQQI